MQEDAHQSEGVSPLSGSFLASNNVWLPNTSLTGENHNEAMLGPDSFYRPRSPNHVGLSDDSQIFEEHIVDLGLRWPDPSADAILPPPASAAAENAIDEQTGYSTTEGSIDAHVDEMTSFANQNPLSFTEFDETNFLIQSYAPQAGASFRTSQFPLDSDIISWPFSTSISRDHLQNAQVPRSVTHLPSVLVTHWFERVCLIWSGYDSHLNLNRNIAAQLWQDSEPVYNCLQSMSAASLSANIPHMRKTATAHLGCAVRDISALKGKILETGQQNDSRLPSSSHFCVSVRVARG